MFRSVVGHKDVKEKMSRLIPNQTGTYLLYGPPSVGKRTFAFEAAKHSLCVKSSEDGCECESCKSFPLDHPDFLSIGTKDRVKVGSVDEVIEFTSTAPFTSPRKVAVIDNVDDATWEASNRLLKILEEPPEKFTFFLVATDLNRMFETVKSRCLKIRFGSLPQDDMVNIVWKRMGFELPQARILGWMGAGSSVDVFSNAGIYLRYRDQALEFVSGVRRRDEIDSLDYIDKIIWKELVFFVDMLVLILTDILLLKNGIENIVNADLREDLQILSKDFNDKALVSAVSFMSQAKKHERYHVNMNLTMKCLLIRCLPLFKADA